MENRKLDVGITKPEYRCTTMKRRFWPKRMGISIVLTSEVKKVRDTLPENPTSCDILFAGVES